jgi:hypothetical protein
MLFGCELTEDGDQPKHVAARQDEIYISIQQVNLLVLRDCRLTRVHHSNNRLDKQPQKYFLMSQQLFYTDKQTCFVYQ